LIISLFALLNNRESDKSMDYYFTTKEISLLLKTPIQFIRKMIREEKIIAYKIGRQYVVKEQDLNNYLDSVKYER